LTVGRVNDVTGREDARDGRPGRPTVNGDGAFGRQIQFALDEIHSGIIADGHENTGHGQHALGPVNSVRKPECSYLVGSIDTGDCRVPLELDLVVVQRTVLHNLRGA
jgi:hypothetical protein